MKAIISSTYDDKYLFYIPLVTWAWNRLGVDVVCFMPERYDRSSVLDKKIILENDKKTYRISDPKFSLVLENCANKNVSFVFFKSPSHKEATYAQCSRLYAACLDLPEDEILVTGDVDMVVFQNLKQNIDYSVSNHGSGLTTFGYDLVPDGQLPICYAWASVIEWRRAFNKYKITMERYGPTLEGIKTYQQHLDELLGDIDCEGFRGNYWSKDQEILFEKFKYNGFYKIPRAKTGTQFAMYRYDRDDAYLLDRLWPDTIDFHMPRPGYEANNFEIIMKVLEYHYPHDNFDWLKQYREEYIKLL